MAEAVLNGLTGHLVPGLCLFSFIIMKVFKVKSVTIVKEFSTFYLIGILNSALVCYNEVRCSGGCYSASQLYMYFNNIFYFNKCNFFQKKNEKRRSAQGASFKQPAPPGDFCVVVRADKRPQGEHEQRFNAPQAQEVAVLMVGEPYDKRNILIHP